MSARIELRQVSLDIPIYLQRERSATGWARMFLGAAFDSPRRERVRLLDDISFELNEGDRLAILGRNGAGKSTLLRVLNQVYQPTSGQVVVQGSCQALLNMSLGFSGEATVRENIFLRGVATGLRAAFLRNHVDDILEFSGLASKATHRLRTLSSGQKMRLGFAISTAVQNDIILMDEWVGAGDAEFMAKATERMKNRVGGSKIVVLASHSVGLLRDICNKGIVIEGGRVVAFDEITVALKAYHDLLARLREAGETASEVAAVSGAQAYGCAEQLLPGPRAGEFVLKGWLVDTEGALPPSVVIEVNGTRHAIGNLKRVRRPDVARHLGLSTEACGFEGTFAVPGARSVADLGPQVLVFGGDASEHARAPLRIAPRLAALLAESPPTPA
jgi:ABC-type polysaccharide/polyol phosphate transport system ATPase subunit